MMMGDTEIAIAVCTLPLLGFLAAGLLEFKRDRQSLLSRARLLPISVGIAASALLLVDIYLPYVSLRLSGSKVMSVLAFAAGLGALFCRYKSRLTTIISCVAGVLLGLLWLLNTWVA